MPLPKTDLDRPPLRLIVRFREETRAAVVALHHVDVMKGGMLIRTRQSPMIALGTRIVLSFRLANGEEVFRGVGLVAWLQRNGAQLGVGVQFQELSPDGEDLYRDMLALRELETLQDMTDQMELEDEFLEAPTWPRKRVASG